MENSHGLSSHHLPLAEIIGSVEPLTGSYGRTVAPGVQLAGKENLVVGDLSLLIHEVSIYLNPLLLFIKSIARSVSWDQIRKLTACKGVLQLRFLVEQVPFSV